MLRDGPDLFVDSMPQRWRAEAFLGAHRDEEDKSYASIAYVAGAVPDPTGGDDGTDPTVKFAPVAARRAVADAVAGCRMPGATGSMSSSATPRTATRPRRVSRRRGTCARPGVAAARRTGGRRPDRGDTRGGPRRSDRVVIRTPVRRRGALAPRRRAAGGRGRRGGRARVLIVDTTCSSASLYTFDIAPQGAARASRRRGSVRSDVAVGPSNFVISRSCTGCRAGGEVRPSTRPATASCSPTAPRWWIGQAARGRPSRQRSGVRLRRVRRHLVGREGRGDHPRASMASSARLPARGSGRRGPRSGCPRSSRTPRGRRPGDLCGTLGRQVGPGRELVISSDKSVHRFTPARPPGPPRSSRCLLTFRHGVIPPQHRFRAAPARLATDGAVLRCPRTRAVARRQKPQFVAVSGSGRAERGGAGAVADRPDLKPPAPSPERDGAEDLG